MTGSLVYEATLSGAELQAYRDDLRACCSMREALEELTLEIWCAYAEGL